MCIHIHKYTYTRVCTHAYTCTHTCTQVHTYMHTAHMCTHAYTCMCKYIYTHVHRNIHIGIHACTGKYTYTCTHKYTHMYTHMHMQIHTYTHMHIQIHVHTGIHTCPHMHKYIYTCIHIHAQIHIYTHALTKQLSSLRCCFSSQSCPCSTVAHPPTYNLVCYINYLVSFFFQINLSRLQLSSSVPLCVIYNIRPSWVQAAVAPFPALRNLCLHFFNSKMRTIMVPTHG